MILTRACAAAILAIVAGPAASQQPEMRLEALAERIAKLHAQLGQGVLTDRSRRAMPEAIRDFESTLRAATARASTPEVRDNYVLLRLLWMDYRGWALKPPSREHAKRLSERAEEVAWIAAKGARSIHEPGRRGTGRLALEAAHAATLSQRVARLHLLRRWGLRDAALASALAQSSAQLRATIDKLRSASANTPEIDTELQVVEGQMAFLLVAAQELEAGRGSVRQMEFIAKSGDHIFESMERVVRLYEGLPP